MDDLLRAVDVRLYEPPREAVTVPDGADENTIARLEQEALDREAQRRRDAVDAAVWKWYAAKRCHNTTVADGRTNALAILDARGAEDIQAAISIMETHPTYFRVPYPTMRMFWAMAGGVSQETRNIEEWDFLMRVRGRIPLLPDLPTLFTIAAATDNAVALKFLAQHVIDPEHRKEAWRAASLGLNRGALEVLMTVTMMHPDTDNRVALLTAAAHDRLDIVELVLDRCSGGTFKPSFTYTRDPLGVALRAGSMAVALDLVSRGAVVTEDAVMDAIHGGYDCAVQYALDNMRLVTGGGASSAASFGRVVGALVAARRMYQAHHVVMEMFTDSCGDRETQVVEPW